MTKDNNSDFNNSTSENNGQDVENSDQLSQTELVEKARVLANKAVAEKSSDLFTAVQLMEECVTYHPIDKYLARLAYYYHLAGRKDMCVDTHLRRFDLLDKSDPLSYHASKQSILDDLRKFYFREGEYTQALKFQCEAEWCEQIGLACQGKVSDDMLRNWKPLEGNNVKKAFRKLNREDSLDSFRGTFKNIFESHLDSLIQLASISKSYDWADDRLRRESLSKNTDFQDAYSNFIDEGFVEQFESMLAPLLN